MAISLTCAACGKRLKAPDNLAGKIVPCPACKQKIPIPLAEDDIADLLLESEPAADPEPAPPEPEANDAPAPRRDPYSAISKPYDADRARPAQAAKQNKLATLPPLGAGEPPTWSRHLHWLLVLALIPLAFSLLQEAEPRDELYRRLHRTIEQAPPGVKDRVNRLMEKSDPDAPVPLAEIIALLPEQKLPGAFLSQGTKAHWIMALAATVLFMAFLLLLTTYRSASPVQLFWIGLFTATAGLGFLLALQWLAFHMPLRIGGGIVALLMLLVKLIGYSYMAALHPDNGFLLSFVGFTLGVGLCEEVCKALPILWHYRNGSEQDWHGAFLLGLASGAAFGIGEGIMYSANFYNGVQGPGIYVVRFISCVALHALWTGSVAITVNQNQHLLTDHESWYEFIPPVFLIVSVPMVLHGLYDTLLKKDMNAWAMLVAIVSFLYLAFQISRLRGQDDVAANKAMLKEYKRRKAAM